MKSIGLAMTCAIGFTYMIPAADSDYTPDQEFAAVRNSLTRTRAALQQFCWNTHTVVSLNGQVKKISDHLCRYGPDGTVYETPLATPPPPKAARELRRRATQVQIDDLEDTVGQAVALAHDYVPPSPQKLETLFDDANALFVKRAGSEQTQLEFKDYLKPGDSLVLTFDPSTKSLHAIDVTSYLTDQSDVVTLHVIFQSLSDGTSYAATSLLNATGRHIQVSTENMNYRKIWQ